MVVEVQVAVKQRPLTSFEQSLLTRGIPTVRMVQDRIAEDMRRWLEPRLGELEKVVMAVIKQDIAAGRIEEPVVGVKADPPKPNSELATDKWWEEATTEWTRDAENWLSLSMAEAAKYQARRFNFYVDMRMINQAAFVYTQNTWQPDLIKIDGGMSIVKETRQRVWDAVWGWQQGLLPGTGLPALADHLAKTFDPVRANRIAVTEATRVFAEGSRAAWLSGAKPTDTDVAFGITAMRWQTAADELVCDTCKPLNGKQMLLNRDFPDIDGGVPPAHVSCRCWITPVKNPNPKLTPKGARKPSKSAIHGMRKQTLPDRVQGMLKMAARGTDPSMTLDQLAEKLEGVDGWTGTWRTAYTRSFKGLPRKALDFMCRRDQYSGQARLREVEGVTSCFRSEFGGPGGIDMEREYRTGMGRGAFVLRHELGHAYDWQLGGSQSYYSGGIRFSRAWQKYRSAAVGFAPDEVVEQVRSPRLKYSSNAAIGDIYNALGDKTAWGHSEEYWEQSGDKGRGRQIFANLFSLRARASQTIYNSLKEAMPDLIEVFEGALEL